MSTNFEQISKYTEDNGSHFYLSQKDATNKKRQKTRKNPEVLDWNWRLSVGTHGFKYFKYINTDG